MVYHYKGHSPVIQQVNEGRSPLGLQRRIAPPLKAQMEPAAYRGGFHLFTVILSGIPLALIALINGAALCCTIVGIPFGLQCFKIAKPVLSPFGARVV
ncbi:MAG: YccF domain-containing protein [Christensenellaceae bacterium]|nr:YccF domain-containing protein [Christensenellaceae bacterium]